jgi:FAD:protein FMN transferase
MAIQKERTVVIGDIDKPMVRASHNAMAALFEIYALCDDADYANSAAREAFETLDRLEDDLSRFVPHSDVSRINALQPGQSVQIAPHTMECLLLAQKLCKESSGAFDPTIGPLFCYYKERGWIIPQDESELKALRERVGMNLLSLREQEHSVSVLRSGVMLDLGGIGKGFALDNMIDELREWNLDAALLHGGESSVYALGKPPGKDGWTLQIRHPENQQKSMGTVTLCNRALSGSGRMIVKSGQPVQHIIDPRSGHPVKGRLSSWAIAPTAGESDALSTAFLIMDKSEISTLCKRRPEISGMVVDRDSNDLMHITPIGKIFEGEEWRI